MLFCVLMIMTIQSKYKIRILNNVILLITGLFLGMTSCTQKETSVPIKQHSLYQRIKQLGDNDGKISPNEIDSIRQDFGRVFEIWFNEIMRYPEIALPNDSLKAEVLTMHYRKNKMIYSAIESHYKSYPNLNGDIGAAFSKLSLLLPNLPIPVVYDYISEFSNTTTFSDTAFGNEIVAYSVECFLNDTFALYKVLNDYPEFMGRYNATELIPSTLVLNYLKSHYDTGRTNTKMVDEMFLSGKMWYTLEQVFGEKNLFKHFGYTNDDWIFLNQNEGQIWHHYIISESLFSSDFNDYIRYFNFGNKTFGSGIHEDCPPLIGFYSGYKMVKSLMDNKNLSMAQLWTMTDGAAALRQSGYKPRR